MDKELAEAQHNIDRLVNLSDGVMAIAITLLVFNLKAPVLAAGATERDLWTALVAQEPAFVSFLTSFVVVGLYWIAHHGTFAYIVRFDGGLFWLNLLFLFFITLLPFVSSLLGAYSNLGVANACYAAVVGAIGLARTAMWLHACRGHRLVDKRLDRSTIRHVTVMSLIVPLIFLVSIPFDFTRPRFNNILWWVGPILCVILNYRYHNILNAEKDG